MELEQIGCGTEKEGERLVLAGAGYGGGRK